MQSSELEKQFAICINNQDYPASLELRKIYQVLPDERAAQHQMIEWWMNLRKIIFIQPVILCQSIFRKLHKKLLP